MQFFKKSHFYLYNLKNHQKMTKFPYSDTELRCETHWHFQLIPYLYTITKDP